MLEDKNILLGVCGGIAAYKSVDLASRLGKLGAKVKVIMTENAQEFVTELSFRTVTSNPVYGEMFSSPLDYSVEHISLAEWADLIIVAPATANIIGKISSGIADDLLTTVIMASKADLLIAPAMNENMYLNPIVQDNISKLENLSYKFIGPERGNLACKVNGLGRMTEPEDIVNRIVENFTGKKDLLGKKVLVTAGPTVEEVDPVRYISNYSSGKMGYAIAKEAKSRGAQVVLVSGPTNLEPPRDISFIQIKSALDMLKVIDREFESLDIIVKAAAVCDYRMESPFDKKIKKKDKNQQLILNLVKNPDIAQYLGRKKGDRILVGFAAETNDLIANAKKKLVEKNLDFIVANDVSMEGAGFDEDTNIVSIIDRKEIKNFKKMNKDQVASLILDKVSSLL